MLYAASTYQVPQSIQPHNATRATGPRRKFNVNLFSHRVLVSFLLPARKPVFTTLSKSRDKTSVTSHDTISVTRNFWWKLKAPFVGDHGAGRKVLVGLAGLSYLWGTVGGMFMINVRTFIFICKIRLRIYISVETEDIDTLFQD